MVQEMMFRRTAITASGRGLAKAALPGSFMAVLFWLFAGLVHPLLANNENLGNQSIGNEIVGLRLGQIEIQQKPGLRLVVEMVRPVKARLLLLDKPWRLVIDAADTDWQADGLLPAGDLDNPPARRYRFGHPEPGIGRLVIELDSPAAPLRAFTLPPRNSDGIKRHRLVIDLQDRGETAFRVARAALQKNPYLAEPDGTAAGESLPSPATVTVAAPQGRPDTTRLADIGTPAQRPARWVVAIDAGHGGKDPGALGRRGTQEKQVTLTAARALARYLEASGRVSPYLTRSDDRFIHLRQRITLARNKQADLFVSLHADAAQSRDAYGISVFSLSDTASDKEAAYLARQENQADLIGGPDLSAEDPLAASALLGMYQRESMNESTQLAKAILAEMQEFRGGARRGHRFAGFAVLKSPDIPSVLVEMGFLTNAEDEANLRQSAYLDRVARQLAKAILAYLENSGR